MILRDIAESIDMDIFTYPELPIVNMSIPLMELNLSNHFFPSL